MYNRVVIVKHYLKTFAYSSILMPQWDIISEVLWITSDQLGTQV